MRYRYLPSSLPSLFPAVRPPVTHTGHLKTSNLRTSWGLALHLCHNPFLQSDSTWGASGARSTFLFFGYSLPKPFVCLSAVYSVPFTRILFFPSSLRFWWPGVNLSILCFQFSTDMRFVSIWISPLTHSAIDFLRDLRTYTAGAQHVKLLYLPLRIQRLSRVEWIVSID